MADTDIELANCPNRYKYLLSAYKLLGVNYETSQTHHSGSSQADVPVLCSALSPRTLPPSFSPLSQLTIAFVRRLSFHSFESLT